VASLPDSICWMALRYTSMAFRQSSFCSNFRALSLSFSRLIRHRAEKGETGDGTWTWKLGRGLYRGKQTGDSQSPRIQLPRRHRAVEALEVGGRWTVFLQGRNRWREAPTPAIQLAHAVART